MGCKICNNYEKDENLNFQRLKLSSDDLIKLLVDKRNHLLSIKNAKSNEISYNEPELENLKDEFFRDVNNEKNLINYLDELKLNKYSKDYQKILTLYFDVLSCDNKKKYSNIKGTNIIPNLKKFELMVDYLFIGKSIDSIKIDINYHDLSYRKILFENKIISIYPNVDKILSSKEEKNIIDKNFSKEIKLILKDRINSKITLDNEEIFFQFLIDLYASKFFYNKENNKNERYRENFLIMYNLIKFKIREIEKGDTRKMTKEKKILFFIIMFSPIIALDCQLLSNHFTFKILEPIKLIVKENSITFNNIYNKTIFQCNQAKIINKNILYDYLKIYENNSFPITNFKHRIFESIYPENFQDYNFYTYDNIYWEFNKKLLKYILQSNTIKSLYKYIFPEIFKTKYIFDDDWIINELFDSFIFVPFKLNNAYGITSKPLLKIFLNGLGTKYMDHLCRLNGCSSFQILGIHEVGSHWTASFCSLSLRDNDLLNSLNYKNFPVSDFQNEYIREKLGDLDGGEIIEILLFSRVMHTTDIKEILFILCKNSYDDDFKDFKKNFKNLKNIEITELYSKLIKDKDLKSFLDYLKIDINTLKYKSQNSHLLKYKRDGKMLNTSKCNHNSINRICY